MVVDPVVMLETEVVVSAAVKEMSTKLGFGGNHIALGVTVVLKYLDHGVSNVVA